MQQFSGYTQIEDDVFEQAFQVAPCRRSAVLFPSPSAVPTPLDVVQSLLS